MKTIPTQSEKLDVKTGMVKRGSQVVGVLAFFGAILFLAAGRLDWTWAWIYLALNLAVILVNMVVMVRVSPETIARRAEARGMKSWDKVVGGLWGLVYYLFIPLVAGLDARFQWTGDLAMAVHLAGVLLFVLGIALFSWAMASNAYFSTVSRVIAGEQMVCDRGPYRSVRHPGYIGAILQNLGVPLLLGSLWGLLPGFGAAALMVARTVLEDRMLQVELPGYAGYARRVRYRLLPGIW